VDKLPPHNLEAEESVLGSCLIDNDAVWEVRDLEPADFYRERNAWVWTAITALSDTHRACDQVSVGYQLGPERLEAIGGAGYLNQLVADVPTSLHVKHYAGIVAATARRRRLISTFAKLVQMAYEQPDPDATVAEAIRCLTADGDSRDGLVSLGDYLADDADYYADFEADPRTQVGLLSGLPAFDRLTGGFQPGDLVVVCARPSIGKSQFALTLALSATREKDTTVPLFSLEMTRRQLGRRILAAWAGVNLADVEAPDRGWQGNELERWREARAKAAKRGLYIDQTRGLTTADIRARLVRHTARHATTLVLVDYLDLLTDAGDSEVQRRGDICRQLKAMAGHFGVPVVLVSQLNRQVEQRSDKRPMLSDLRSSGEIEQVADIVVGLYRDAYYNDQTPTPDLLEAIVLKHRNGQTGTARLAYHVETGRISKLAREER
jgi:replicative DNA helicase